MLQENTTYGHSFPWTPLQLASAATKNQQIIDFLIKHGAILSIIDKAGRTAQEIAEYFGKKLNFQN
jgi:ankyrin repeat protein